MSKRGKSCRHGETGKTEEDGSHQAGQPRSIGRQWKWGRGEPQRPAVEVRQKGLALCGSSSLSLPLEHAHRRVRVLELQATERDR